MNRNERYRLVYGYAEQFLRKIVAEHPELNEKILEEHLTVRQKFNHLFELNKRLMESLLNKGGARNIIKFDEREKELTEILYGFEPKKILEHYPSSEQLFERFGSTFEINNADSPLNTWKQFSKGIISGSRFISSFVDINEFDSFVNNFSFNKYTKAALPMLLSKEINGFGFALACDFLKDSGYKNYPKPDRHLKKIFYQLGLSDSEEDYEVYKSIIEMSEAVEKDAYTVDKTFYLIGSGNFNLSENLPNTGNNEDKFIKEMKARLGQQDEN
ncbi:Uncharacterised protein [Candidatus Gugararchaeum adminiculabundum]|nr:Uncharacterised protein [Candidatus Gugararchaeum adminiculabundum]